MTKWVQLAFQCQSMEGFVAAGLSLVCNAIHVVYFQEKAFLFSLCLLCNYEIAMTIGPKMRMLPK
jgi:hypothetical protein